MKYHAKTGARKLLISDNVNKANFNVITILSVQTMNHIQLNTSFNFQWNKFDFLLC